MIEPLEMRIAPAVLLTNAAQLANDPDSPNVVATDYLGNIFVAGVFRGSIDVKLGSGVTNLTSVDASFGDIFVAKYDSDFHLLWAKSWGGDGPETPSAIVTDFNDGVFVAGTFKSANAGFGGSGTLSSTSASETFLFKLNTNTGAAVTDFDGDGQLTFGNGSDDGHGNALILENSGYLLLGGDFAGSGNGVNGSGSFFGSTTSGYVVRLDPTTGQPQFSLGSSQGGLNLSAGGETEVSSVFRIAHSEGSDIFVGLTGDGTGGVESSVLRYDTSGNPVSNYGNLGSVLLGTDVDHVDFTVDGSGQVTAATISAGVIRAFRFFGSFGNPDPTFGLNAGAGQTLYDIGATSVSIELDYLGHIYLAGETTKKDYLLRMNVGGGRDSTFSSDSGQTFFGSPGTSSNTKLGLAIDSEGYVILRGGYLDNPDLDPTSGVTKLPARYAPGIGSPDTLEDAFLLRIDPSGVKAGQPFVISGGFDEGSPSSELLVTTSLTGPGRAHVIEANDGRAGIASIELFDTTLSSNLKVSLQNPFVTPFVGSIYTHGNLQHVGSISVDSGLLFGDLSSFRQLFNAGNFSGSGLYVSGKINSISLGDLRAGVSITLGKGLPYNEPNATTPDTYNNHPNLTLGNVGEGVLIDVTGDGFTPQGVGGGGLGKVVVESWPDSGLIRTTQSIGSFIVKHGDFFGVLEVDKFHLGENTTANVGEMTIQDGDWGSSGSEIEGNIGQFNVDEFLAGASIIAGSVSKINASESFNGELILTESTANSFGSFDVMSDFTGKITSLSSLKKLNIRGDFKGSLSAPSIASITAFSFLGTTAEDADGDPDKQNITTTLGLLGKITAKSGVIKDYEFNSPVAFGGIKVALKNLINPTIGIQNVKVNAASIGPIEVSLSGKAGIAGLNLAGIANSSFTSTGKMGAVTVKIKGASGQGLGLNEATFAADSIGKVTINVSKGAAAGARAQAVNGASFTAVHTLAAVNIGGDATEGQANLLQLRAGGTIASVTVTSKKAEFGSLSKSSVLAGQSTDLAAIESVTVLKRRVAAGALGAVKISGTLSNSVLAAGGDMAQVTVGGDLQSSLILGSALLGADGAVGAVLEGDADRFYRGAQMAGVTIKGALVQSSISNGIDPVNGTFGDADDLAAAPIEGLDVIAAIKAISIGRGVTVSPTPPVDAHTFALQAGLIGKLTVGNAKFTDFSIPLLLTTSEAEGAEDILLRLIN